VGPLDGVFTYMMVFGTVDFLFSKTLDGGQIFATFFKCFNFINCMVF
jgi:hypothetical protein